MTTADALPARVALPRSVVAQRRDGTLSILDLDTSTVVMLDEVGASIWDALVATTSVESAIELLVAEYDVDPGVLRRDVAALIARLVGHAMLALGEQPTPAVTIDGLRDRYLDLMVRSLCGVTSAGSDGSSSLATVAVGGAGSHKDPSALSMVGVARMRNVRDLCERAIREGIEGDFVECGVWRGGVGIMMRAVLEAHGQTNRRIWLADSFQGLPVPDLERYPIDKAWASQAGQVAVSRDDVARNLQAYGLLDDRVRFLEGWFRDTLAAAPVDRIAVLRLDGDLYESTMDCLVGLYDRVTAGGYVIVDDYAIGTCRQAVQDFAAARGFEPALTTIDWTGVWWRKSVDD